MSKRHLVGLGACAFVLGTVPAFAGLAVPAPVIGGGLSGLVTLGLAGAGYLFMRHRNRKR